MLDCTTTTEHVPDTVLEMGVEQKVAAGIQIMFVESDPLFDSPTDIFPAERLKPPQRPNVILVSSRLVVSCSFFGASF